MKYLQIIVQILVLFILFQIGEWIKQEFHLLIPGSVIGLVLLFLLLISGLFKEKFIDVGANFMMKHLVLFFIPATVGIMNYFEMFKGKGLLLIPVIIVSTLVVMCISGYISQKVDRRGARENA